MKPNFALNFTDDGIALLHRTRRGWAEIGATPFDTDDLPAALAALRAKAEELAPDGITTKLVIPNSQIKYLAIEAPGPDAAKRRAQIAAGLEGRTPYDVADLVWDHWGKGPTVQVAVLARETLDEAEAFAVEHGFNPVSFVAIPADAAYAGEPWFGAAAHAATLLKPGEKVDRDQDPIRLPPVESPAETPAAAKDDLNAAAAAEPSDMAEPDPKPEPEPEPETRPDPLPETTPLPDTEPVQVPPPEPETVPEPEPAEVPDPGDDPLPAPEPLPIPESDPTPDIAPPDLPQDLPAFDPMPDPVTAGPLPDPSYDPARIAATLNAPDPEQLPEPAPRRASVTATSIDDPDEAPMALDVDDPGDPARQPVNGGTVQDDLPPMPAAIAMAAFNSRARAEAPAAPRTVPRVTNPSPAPAGDRPAPKAERPARPAPKFSYETPGERPAQQVGKGLKSLGAIVTATSIPGGRKARAMGAGATTAAAADTPPAPPRRPSGLGTRPMPVRGKPRHLGLILTGLLLIMLALAAGLSSFYISWRDQTPEVDTAAAGATDLPAPEDEMAADGIVPETESEMAAAPPSDGVVTEVVDPVAVRATETPATAPEPAPQGIAAAAPDAAAAPASTAQDEIFLAASDNAPRTTDAAALPTPAARSDAQPQAPPPPPPYGTVYQFDANGLIVPTPEGILSPEGVLLTAGRPARVPPPRPESVTAAAAEAAPGPTADAAAAPEAEVAIPADPALANARPRSRPADLVPAAPAAADDAALAPLADPRLAGLRPAARPAEITAAAVAAGAIAPVSAGNNGSLALVAPEGTVTPVGLAISRRPAARPEDMARAIEEAVAAVTRLPDPAPPPVEEVLPDELDEPELAAAPAPRIPSTANVARQATIANAINLRQINLIGVYGTPNARYALVRNANGRYSKVSVGDRLDGGRVAAITASELRYEKRGRMVVLALPDS